MDQHRHHEINSSNGERQSAMYFNRGIEDIRPQNQYYSHQEAIGNNSSRLCSSMPSDITCTTCNTGATEENWKTEIPQRGEFYNSNPRNKVSHSPFYVHESKSLYQQRGTSYELKPANKGTVSPQTPRTIPSKSCALETNCNLKQHQHQIHAQLQHAPADLNIFSLPTQPQQQHMSAIGIYCKDRSFDDKYTSRQELYVDIKSGYPSTASSTSYNDVIRNQKATIETVRNVHVDQNIITPSNLISSQEQQSPNYGRKCPQICTSEEQNVPHHSLYMSTPQFSSDKFTTIPVQNKNLSESEYQHRQLYNPTSDVHVNSDPTKLKEMQPSSPSISTFPTRSNRYNHINDLLVKQQITHHEPTSVIGSTLSQGQINYYIPSSKIHSSASEISSIIVRQSHTQQYSESHASLPLSQSSSHRSIKSGHEFVDYVRKDDNLYNGLYSSIESCCKEIPTPCTITNTNIESLPQIYKCGKEKKGLNTTNKICVENQNTPPTKSSAFKARTYFYENQDVKYENDIHGTKTSAAITASPSSASNTQLQYNNFTLPSQPYSQYTQAYHQHQPETLRSMARIPPDSAIVSQQSMAYDQQQQRSKSACLNTEEIITQCSQPVQKGQNKLSPLPTLKKSQAAKPNYRELINQVYAMRSATSEEELNRQIIKKALNSANTTISGNLSAPAVENFQQRTVLQNNSQENYIVESVPSSSHLMSKPPINLPETKRVIKTEEHFSSPLDLSMRTIKTKADSTEYKYQSLSKNSSIDYKQALPRVEFTPNFSLHVEDQNISTKSVTRLQSIQSFTSAHGTPISDICYLKTDQTQKQSPTNLPHVKDYSNAGTVTDGVLVSNIIYSSNLKPQCLQSMPSNRNVKTSANQDIKICQMRPSVLETNPFAAIKLNKPETRAVKKSITPVGQQPADNKVLSKPISKNTDSLIVGGVIKNIDKVSVPPFCSGSSYDKDPKYVGRKRHLQEYSNSQCNEPIVKQTRYTGSSSVSQYLPSAETAVITVNKRVLEMECLKTVEKSIQAEIPPCFPQNKSIIVANDNVPICKTEPVTPILETPLPPPQFIPVKMETSTLIAARIRTKAELKGFTFHSPLENKNLSSENIKVKEEPTHDVSVELSPITDLNDEYSSKSFLDKTWSNTCNEFMEQLIINSKMKLNKRKLENIKLENSESNIVTLKNDSINTGPNRYLSNIDSADTSISFDMAETYDSTFTGKSLPPEVAQVQSTIVQKKSSKQDREKLRLQQEKRLAARLKVESSSESSDEFHKRKCERPKKILRRVKNRPRMVAGKARFSDCGSDSSTDISEKEVILAPNLKQVIEQKKNPLNASTEVDDSRKCIKKQTEVISLKSDKKHMSMKSDSKEKDQICKASDKNSNKSKVEKSNITKNITPSIKECLNTMTRSKRKQEMEIQLANSKVLRNDKIIRNSTTKIKRKYVRKLVSNPNSLSNCKELSDHEVDRTLAMRLRSKQVSSKNEKAFGCTKKKSMKNEPSKNEVTKPKGKGNERQSDLYLEVYRYKRSLKVPPSLITIDHPQNIKMAASLPDLEYNPEATLFMNKNTKLAKSVDTLLQKSTPFVHTQTQQLQISNEPRSIIDVLHSRVLNSNIPIKSKCKKNCVNNASVPIYSESLHNTESNCITDLLPISKKEENDESCEGKKRHFSIFETKVLQTKTRTESKLQQRKEIIREIFVGDDRPASAPPEISQMSDGSEKMTFEQKYEQFLQQLNIVINEDKLRRYEKGIQPLVSTSNPSGTVREETFNDTLDSVDVNNKRNKCSIANLRRRRPGKYLRRKGSSGFDYIRKKKKTSTTISVINATQNIQVTIKTDKSEECHEQKFKSENDVCREIQKWVLNKSVGQSTMHKAARLGYIDVIVYCLDRIGMNPDQKDNAGYTPLHEACTKGWLEIARILLQYGANHSEAALSGIRPLHEASENDHEEVVRLLLSYGADPLLATYSGQTPLMLASSAAMRDLLKNHLSDVQNVGPDSKPWIFKGPWEILDAANCGYDVFGGAPNFTCDMSRALRKSSVSNSMSNKKQLVSFGETRNCKKTIIEQCAVVLDNIDRFNSLRLHNDNNKSEFLVENSDSEGEVFEFEEADVLLPPLYLLKDEGSEKWVLLNDLCNLLKVKSKDTLLNKIYPPSSSVSSAHKNLMRELKMSDFLEKATCLQLLCAGEKINICASKVVLIKYNDSVRNLLGVKTILMKF